jgi:hypothetical protein
MSQDARASQRAGSGARFRKMAHHEDRFCRRRPWSDFIREVGSGGGSIALTQRPINSYVNLQGDYTSRQDFLHQPCKKTPILVNKCN